MVVLADRATAEITKIERAATVVALITIHLLQTIIIQTQTTTETGMIERETESTWTREMKRAGGTKAVVEQLLVAAHLRILQALRALAATSLEKVAPIIMEDHLQQLI